MIVDLLIILGAAMTAAAMETMYRYHEGDFSDLIPIVILSGLFVTFGVWKVMKISDSLIGGMILFSLFTAGSRLFATYFVLHETPRLSTLAAFGLIVCANLLSKFWR